MKKLLLSLAMIPVLATPSMASLSSQHESFGTCNRETGAFATMRDTVLRQGDWKFNHKEVSVFCVIKGVVYNEYGTKLAKVGVVNGSGKGTYRYQYELKNGVLSKYTCGAKDYYSDECVSRPKKETFLSTTSNPEVVNALKIENTIDRCLNGTRRVDYIQSGPMMQFCLTSNKLKVTLIREWETSTARMDGKEFNISVR